MFHSGCSLCAWLNIGSLAPTSGFSNGAFKVWTDTPSFMQLAMGWNAGTSTFNWNGPAPNGSMTSNFTIPALNQWFFVHLFYDAASGQIGLSLNNSGASFLSATPTVVPWQAMYFQIENGTQGTFMIDEFMVTTHKLSDAAVTTLYNAGTGITWPLPTGLY